MYVKILVLILKHHLLKILLIYLILLFLNEIRKLVIKLLLINWGLLILIIKIKILLLFLIIL